MSDNLPTQEDLDQVARDFFKEVSERRNNNPIVPQTPKIETTIINSDQVKDFIKEPPKDLVKTIKV